MADRGYIENKIETILAYTAPELVVWKLMVLLEENGLFVDEDFYDEEEEGYEADLIVGYLEPGWDD